MMDTGKMVDSKVWWGKEPLEVPACLRVAARHDLKSFVSLYKNEQPYIWCR